MKYDVICWPHEDVIKWIHFPPYWPFVRGIHRSPVNSPYNSQWGGALMFPFICAWIKGWANNLEAGDLRRHRAHYDASIMCHSIHVLLLDSIYLTCDKWYIASYTTGNIKGLYNRRTMYKWLCSYFSWPCDRICTIVQCFRQLALNKTLTEISYYLVFCSYLDQLQSSGL